MQDRPLFSTVSARRISTRRHQDYPLPSRPAAKSQRRRNQISRPPIDRGPLAPIPSGHRQARGDPQMVRLCRPPALATWHDLNRHVRASSRTDLIDALPPTSICSGAARIGKGKDTLRRHHGERVCAGTPLASDRQAQKSGLQRAIPNHAAALLKALAIHSNRRQSAQNAKFDFPKAARRAPRSGVFRYGGLLWQRINLAERTIGNEQIDTLALISACSACTGAFAQGSPQPPRPGRGMANDDWAQS